MAKFDDVIEIADRLSKTFPRQRPPVDSEDYVTIIVSDDEFDEISKDAQNVPAGHRINEEPEVVIDPGFVRIKNIRWMPRSSRTARADYE
jgi:hypothetical protein